MGGGKRKFQTRQKYVPPDPKVELEEDKVSEEEHEKRMKLLKEMGLLKE